MKERKQMLSVIKCVGAAWGPSKRTLNETRPTIMPAAKNTNAWINQMTPHTIPFIESARHSACQRWCGFLPCEGQHPQILAKELASEPLTFRAIVSSGVRVRNMHVPYFRIVSDSDVPTMSQRTYMHDMTPMNRT